MALNIKINLEDCYHTESLLSDGSLTGFETVLNNGLKLSIGILISNEAHQLLPNVYNLAFGPLTKEGLINDKMKISHADHSKLFSTIILTAFSFLSQNYDKFLGIDGSNNARAYLYFRLIQNNHTYLSQYFNIYGVNYYIRILRKASDEDEFHPMDINDMEAIPKLIEVGSTIKSDKMYNYFIFNLK